MAKTKQTYEPLLTRCPSTIWKLSPWVGIGSLVLAFCSGIAALVIGLVANGVTQDSWTVSNNAVQPSVLLSLAATAANALLRVAFVDGAAITWWLHAHEVISIGHLISLYDHAYTFKSLFRLSNFSRVTLAAFAMLLLLIDGPLFQRALVIQRTTSTQSTTLRIPVSSSPLNHGSTGITTTNGDTQAETSLYTPDFAQIVRQYGSRTPITLPGIQSSGTITFDLLAPGWDITCENGTSTYRLMSDDEFIIWMQNHNNYTGPSGNQTMFHTNVTYGYTSVGGTYNYEHATYQIQLNSSWKSTPGGNGTMMWRTCTLTEALVRYPIRVENGVVNLQQMPLSENRTEHLIVRMEESGGGYGSYPSTLVGFWIALDQQFTTSSSVDLVLPSNVAIINANAIANQYISRQASSEDLQSYNVSWVDPLDDAIAMANEITLRAAIGLTNQSSANWNDANEIGISIIPRDFNDTKPALNCVTCAQGDVIYPDLAHVNRTTAQQVSATVTESRNVYQTDVGWLVGGFATIIIACTFVAPMYWGWWRLERSFTMNPLDTAKAFDAPLLHDADPCATPDAWCQSVKGTNLQYGRVITDHDRQAVRKGINKVGAKTDIANITIKESDTAEAIAAHKEEPHEILRDSSLPKFRKID